MSDMLMDSLSKLRSNANAARGAKQPERKQELLISIGLAPKEPDSDDMHEQMMGDEHEMMEGERGMDVDDNQAGVMGSLEDAVSDRDSSMPGRRRLPVTY